MRTPSSLTRAPLDTCAVRLSGVVYIGPAVRGLCALLAGRPRTCVWLLAALLLSSKLVLTFLIGRGITCVSGGGSESGRVCTVVYMKRCYLF